MSDLREVDTSDDDAVLFPSQRLAFLYADIPPGTLPHLSPPLAPTPRISWIFPLPTPAEPLPAAQQSLHQGEPEAEHEERHDLCYHGDRR